MNDLTRRQRDEMLRLGGIGLLVGGLVLCYAVRFPAAYPASGYVFALVIALGIALLASVRGLGGRTGAALGLLTAALATGGFAWQDAALAGNLLAFAAIAGAIFGFLGFLAGGTRPIDLATHRPSPPTDGTDPPPTGSPPVATLPESDRRCHGGATNVLSDEIVGALGSDFLTWLESEGARRCYAQHNDLAEFDQFVRSALAERLGARGVRLFEVSADGQRLDPLVRNGAAAPPALSARAGLVGHAVTSGNVYVAGAAEHAPLLLDLADEDAHGADGTGLPVRWSWLLPLRSAKRTCALVAVRDVGRPGCCEPPIAEAVRTQLQMFWSHVSVLRTLWRFMRTDRQSGLLTRTELLNRIDEVVRAANRDGEPLMVLAIAVEGLRRLDDAGQWSERDLLVQRLGHVLGQKVRADDVLGRFSDDRFIVVLRRLDSALGTLVAEKLMDTVRTHVLNVSDPAHELVRSAAGTSALRLRGGLAGTGVQAAPGAARPFATFAEPPDASAQAAAAPAVDSRALLERALQLLDYAREQRIDLATDLMTGLPERLRRGADKAGAAPSAMPADPVAEDAPPVQEPES